jgi:selenide, water dikinase
MTPDWPLSRDLVLIGGGHTHALVLRKWGMNPLPGARLTLINPGPSGPYTGMLPGHIAGHYSREALDIDLVRLARFAGARIIFDTATGLDLQTRHVHLKHRPPVRYDIASIDIGVTAELPGVDGFFEHAHSIKPLGPFARAWEAFLASPPPEAACVLIGGGVAGVETALAMAHRLRSAGLNAPVTLIETRPDILEGSGGPARKILKRALEAAGIKVLAGMQVTSISATAVHLSGGKDLPASFVVSAAGARPHAWIAETGLQHTNGFINIGPTLQAISAPNVFAVGDCAHLTHAPRPKAGVFAVRQAPILYENLKATLSGGTLRSYHPQSDFLKLISLGPKSALAQKHRVTLSGRWLWKVKDHIDRSFMETLRDLPAMQAPSPPAIRALDEEAASREPMLCGGCGSKVGRAGLTSALEGLPAPERPDVITGPGDDAAILQIAGRQQVISTDHLRAFIEDPYLFARIAAVHALGDIWAMGAAPQSGLLTVILPRMTEKMQAATLSEIVTAVRDVLRASGADLAGGHTSMGAELTVGLSVTGLLDQPAIGLSGAQAGDVLILTKPLGTGVLLAGDMRGHARGADVETALSSMQRPLSAAARILAPVAHAMTDVTGFGLSGHLMSILDASGVAAHIELARLPILPGAEQLSAQGVRSSIWRSNAGLDSRIDRPASPLSDLLHDPQTAGGLLAAIPADRAEAVLSALEAAGETARLIGHVETGAPRILVS